jgi:Tol biopolymer transport system component
LVILSLLVGRVVPTGEIAFDSDRDGSSAIYVMDMNRGIQLRITRDDEFRFLNPVWSPDGERIVYVQVESGRAIYVMDAYGENQHFVSSVIGQRAGPKVAWSPDSMQLAFVDMPDETLLIYLMNTDGTHKRQVQLQYSGHAFAPTWSPDGQQIAFSWSPTANAEIWVIPAQETSEIVQATRITSDPMLDTFPAWSPDGQWIAFESGRSGNSEIYLMRPDGSDLHAITNHPAIDTMPAWSPDGKQLVFVSTRDGNSELYLMDADGSNLRRLTYHAALDSHPSWRP